MNNTPTRQELADQINDYAEQYRGGGMPYLVNWRGWKVRELVSLRNRMQKAVELKATNPMLASAYFTGTHYLFETSGQLAGPLAASCRRAQ